MAEHGRILLPDPFFLVERDSVDSTNEEARRLAARGAPDLTLVWAHRQCAGRGRRGRKWIGHDGNLTFSILLRPSFRTREVMQMGFVVANALADVLDLGVPRSARVQVKWPNDVLIKGRKVAGILMEADPAADKPDHLNWLIIGVGVNVAEHPAMDEVEFPATSLAHEGVKGAGLDVGMLLGEVARFFLSGVETWRNFGFDPVRSRWLARARGVGDPVTVRLADETLHGRFAALNGDGALVLHQDGQPGRCITAGDVFFPHNAQGV